ncbi:MAG: F0F1 ATP synthase subunit A, partial [Acidobacteriota bacterium]|nr:F0F1 ATP synthase subunit A [Acidobacteriota bacterium]
MHVTPDEIVYWQSGPIVISATLVFTWAVMLLMVVGSWLITRRLTSDAQMSPGQNLLEIIVMGMQTQIREVSRQDP